MAWNITVWCGNQCCMTTKDWPLDLIYCSSHLYRKQWSTCLFSFGFLDSGGCYHEGILQESLWWNTHRSQKWGDKNKYRGGADIFTALDPCPNCQQVIEVKALFVKTDRGDKQTMRPLIWKHIWLRDNEEISDSLNHLVCLVWRYS